MVAKEENTMTTLNRSLCLAALSILFPALGLVAMGTSVRPEASRAASCGTTTRVSVATGGTQANHHSFEAAISADERYVAFTSQANNLVGNDNNEVWDIFVHDRQTSQTERVSVASSGSEGDGNSHAPDISADGRYVAFSSFATNLVATDTNNVADVLVHDR